LESLREFRSKMHFIKGNFPLHHSRIYKKHKFLSSFKPVVLKLFGRKSVNATQFSRAHLQKRTCI